MIKLFRGIVVAVLILILLTMIHFKWQELKVNKAEIELLEEQKIMLESTLVELKQRAAKISESQETINEKLDQWDDIDTRWLVWIEENWTIVKTIKASD